MAGGSTAATRDTAQIRAWWAQWPHANIGIDTKQSGIVDIAPDCLEWAQTFNRLLPMLSGYAPARGDLADLARRLGVSKATVCRDVAFLKRANMLQRAPAAQAGQRL